MYLKSRERNIIIREAPRPAGLGWPGAAFLASQQPSEIPNPLEALKSLLPPQGESTPSWGSLAAQSSGNPAQAMTAPAAPNQSMLPLVLIGGTGLLALLLLKKKR